MKNLFNTFTRLFSKGSTKKDLVKSITPESTTTRDLVKSSIPESTTARDFVKSITTESTTTRDLVKSITGPFFISQGQEITLVINYIASENRTLVVYFQSLKPKEMHFYKRIDVLEGNKTYEVTFRIPDNIPINKTFRYKTYICPLGGKWADNLSYVKQDGVSYKEA